jgi:very-short-patch-repair endonuclease
MKTYDQYTDSEKNNIIKKLYEQEYKSFQDIAKLLGTYPNKIRRDAIKYKIQIRDKSEAQKNALITGKHTHPTKGKTRSDDIKQKIGKGVLESWENLSSSELNHRKQKAKDNWNKLTEDEKANILNKANKAVREASKQGSKLEKFLVNSLIADGYKIQFHQEQSLVTTKLQIDILIPSMNVAIEVDGPSHFEPVWGDDTLKRNIKYDQKKTGLILGKGLVLIRIKQNKDFSKSRAGIIYDKLKQSLEQIKYKFPDTDNRIILIEDIL